MILVSLSSTAGLAVADKSIHDLKEQGFVPHLFNGTVTM